MFNHYVLNNGYITYNDKIWDEKEFIKALNNFKRIIPRNVKILVISSNETYTNFLNKNRDKLDKQFIFNYNDPELIESLTPLLSLSPLYQAFVSSVTSIASGAPEKLKLK